VLVGPTGEEEKFTVHKDLVCASSKFFMVASSKRWLEGREKAVRLPEVKKETFQAYVVWIYAGKVNVNKSIKGDVKLAAGEEFRETVDLYLLGDVLDDLQLRNAAMRAIVTGLEDWNVQPSCKLINHIWDSTPPGSLLRAMIADYILKRWDSTCSFVKEDVMAQYSKDLLATIAYRLLRETYFSREMSYEIFAAGLPAYLEPETRSKLEARTEFEGRKKLEGHKRLEARNKPEARKKVEPHKNLEATNKLEARNKLEGHKKPEPRKKLEPRKDLKPRKKSEASKSKERPRWR
jgi:hypothetical protein